MKNLLNAPLQMQRSAVLSLVLLLTGCGSQRGAFSQKHVNCDSAAIEDIRSADHLTLYSLVPCGTWSLSTTYPEDAARFRRLPIFHDFPVLGSFSVAPGEPLRGWTELLGSSLVKREQMVCDFMPRHGIRAVKNGRTTDFLMCFSCGDLFVTRHGGPEESHRPVWSNEVRIRLNQAFDQRGIERNKP